MKTRAKLENYEVVEESSAFLNDASVTFYQLMRDQDECLIVKKTVSYSIEDKIDLSADAKALFSDFVQMRAANREKNKKRIESDEAFYQHYVIGKSWRQIANEIGATSDVSFKMRAKKFLDDIADKAMQGDNVDILAQNLDMSANHLNQLINENLEKRRMENLLQYNILEIDQGRFNAQLDSMITTYLNDNEELDYIVVDPLQKEIPITSKSILYSRQFVIFVFDDGTEKNVLDRDADYLSYSLSNSESSNALIDIIGKNNLVDVLNPDRSRNLHYYKRLVQQIKQG